MRALPRPAGSPPPPTLPTTSQHHVEPNGSSTSTVAAGRPRPRRQRHRLANRVGVARNVKRRSVRCRRHKRRARASLSVNEWRQNRICGYSRLARRRRPRATIAQRDGSGPHARPFFAWLVGTELSQNFGPGNAVRGADGDRGPDCRVCCRRGGWRCRDGDGGARGVVGDAGRPVMDALLIVVGMVVLVGMLLAREGLSRWVRRRWRL